MPAFTWITLNVEHLSSCMCLAVLIWLAGRIRFLLSYYQIFSLFCILSHFHLSSSPLFLVLFSWLSFHGLSSMVVVLSLGEAIWSPRCYDYTMSIAPEVPHTHTLIHTYSHTQPTHIHTHTTHYTCACIYSSILPFFPPFLLTFPPSLPISLSRVGKHHLLHWPQPLYSWQR